MYRAVSRRRRLAFERGGGTMSEVTRFNFVGDHPDFPGEAISVQSGDGDYVYAGDYDALRAENADLRKALTAAQGCYRTTPKDRR